MACRRHGKKIEATANLLISADTQKVRSHPANHRSRWTPSPSANGGPPAQKKYELACDAATYGAGSVFTVRRL